VLWAAALVAIPLAIAVALLAVDVLRLSGNVERDDRRFQTAPLRQKGLWEASALPANAGALLAGIEDDVEYRRLLALYRRVEPGRVNFEGFPDLEKLRAKLQFELTRASGEEPDPQRRSRLLTLYGVMTLDKRTLTDDDKEKILQAAVEAFRAAIELDSENEDAKTNLETLLRVFGPVALVGPAPSSGQSEGNVSGQGSAGGGY
jgi:hypothetical protein